MNKKILPELDLNILQEKATEFAMKGAIKEIEDYYSGYNSPFRDEIKKELKEKTISIHLELPDIISLINDSLSEEIDRIANNSIAETFIPLAQNALTRVNKNIKFSDILNEFINACHSDFKDEYRPEVSIDENEKHNWLNISFEFIDYLEKTIKYDITLHSSYDNKGKYTLLSLPRIDEPYNYTKIIKLSNSESSLEIPFTRDALKDEFTSYLARLIISKSEIEMDCNDFSDDMFDNDF